MQSTAEPSGHVYSLHVFDFSLDMHIIILIFLFAQLQYCRHKAFMASKHVKCAVLCVSDMFFVLGFGTTAVSGDS